VPRCTAAAGTLGPPDMAGGAAPASGRNFPDFSNSTDRAGPQSRDFSAPGTPPCRETASQYSENRRRFSQGWQTLRRRSRKTHAALRRPEGPGGILDFARPRISAFLV
jgi:hypothetical protein